MEVLPVGASRTFLVLRTRLAVRIPADSPNASRVQPIRSHRTPRMDPLPYHRRHKPAHQNPRNPTRGCLRGADGGARKPHNVGLCGVPRCRSVHLSAVKPKAPADVVASSEDPVVTGFEATPCMTRTHDAMVSERGLEPPRPKRTLGPQPSISDNTAPRSSRLEGALRRHETHSATRAAMLTRSGVSAEVP